MRKSKGSRLRADTDEPGPAAAKKAFLAELRTFRVECGKPSGRRLARISEDLRGLYPDARGAELDLRALSSSAVSEILAGKRQGLPAADWVASFVLSCQWHAFRIGSISEDPGFSSLPEWQARLRAAEASPGGVVSGGPPPRLFGRGSSPAISRLTPQQEAFVAGHGPYGHELLAGAQTGHPDALYRVALLLGTDPGCTDDALALLIQAATTGHQPSMDLLDATPDCLPPSVAARHACDLAQTAEAAGSCDEALAFYQAAARGGVRGGVLKRAAAMLERRGDLHAAAWLAALADPPGSATSPDLASAPADQPDA